MPALPSCCSFAPVQRIGLFILILCISSTLKGQVNFSMKRKVNPRFSSSFTTDFNLIRDSGKRKHSPKRATIYSAVIPGLGQVYNRKYWKVPIIYGGLGVATLIMLDNRARLRELRTDISYLTDTSSSTMPIHNPGSNLAQLVALRDFRRQNRDYSIIAMGVIYVLNIVDAAVDAHLFDFNINKKLSGRVEPAVNPYGITGCRLSLGF